MTYFGRFKNKVRCKCSTDMSRVKITSISKLMIFRSKHKGENSVKYLAISGQGLEIMYYNTETVDDTFEKLFI